MVAMREKQQFESDRKVSVKSNTERPRAAACREGEA